MPYALAVVLGAATGLGYCLALARWLPAYVYHILVLALVYIAAIYIGPTIGSAAPSDLLEIGFSLVIFALALMALRGSTLWLAAGYIAHGLWDALHGPVLHAALPSWYAPMCLGFDCAAALWIALVLRTSSTAAK